MTITHPPTHDHAPERRLDIGAVAPDAYKAILGVEQHIRRTVDHSLLHLVKLRASILNGCAFCVDMHSREALADGDHAASVRGRRVARGAVLHPARKSGAGPH